MPSNPGDEFTSRTKGPLDERMMSTPAILNPIALVALIAILRSSTVVLTIVEDPPKWTFARNSPGGAVR